MKIWGDLGRRLGWETPSPSFASSILKPKARQANSPSYHSEMAALEKALPKFKRCKITQPQLAVLMRHSGPCE